MHRHPPHPRQRGITLLESLVALLILSLGMLGMVGLQLRLIKAGTDAQNRVVASGLADRLLSLALVDPANAVCYTLPQAGPCPSSAAALSVSQWQSDLAQLPAGAASSTLFTVAAASAPTGSGQQLRVQMQWQGKDESVVHRIEAITDVR